MAGEASTIARPYAEAVFARAKDTDTLDQWLGTLNFLAALVADPQIGKVIANPKMDRQAVSDLVLDIGGEKLDTEAQNLVRLLVQNDRLPVVDEIARMFEALKAEDQKTLSVVVRSAFEIDAEQESQIATMLKAKLGREVTISSEVDPELIGGVHIRAGDLVIDGSVSGQLQQLAYELGI